MNATVAIARAYRLLPSLQDAARRLETRDVVAGLVDDAHYVDRRSVFAALLPPRFRRALVRPARDGAYLVLVVSRCGFIVVEVRERALGVA